MSPFLKAQGTSVPKFSWDPLHVCTQHENCNQILRDDPTILEENFYRVAHATSPVENIFVTHEC